MKKFFKRFLLFFCLPVALLAAFVFGSILYVRNVDHFTQSSMSGHLAFLYNDSEAGIIDDIKSKLESRYERVLKDLKQEQEMSREVYTIMIHPDLNSFQSKIMGVPWWIGDIYKAFGSNVPDRNPQFVGTTDNDEIIRIVSPSNPGNSGYTYDQILDVVVHELTRKVATKVGGQYLEFTGFGYMLSQGLAVYEANQGYAYDNDESFNSKVLAVLPESIDKFSDIDIMTDNGIIYPVGYSFVKYVIDNYGYDKIIELLKNNYDSKTKALYGEWVEYLKS